MKNSSPRATDPRRVAPPLPSLLRGLPACFRLAALLLSSFAFAVHGAPAPAAAAAPAGKAAQIPDSLKPWIPWALWGDAERSCPTSFSDPKAHLCAWPTRLDIQVTPAGAHFAFAVTVFHESWVALPGGAELWPQSVQVNGQPAPVVEHGAGAAVFLSEGVSHIEGAFPWTEVPQRIPVPPEIGLLSLTVDAQPVESPAWDADGFLWLKRTASAEEADKNFLSLKLNAVLEDGIPLWLRTEVELTVSGKSREEELGAVLPEGWKLASVQSPVPVAIDEAGRLKAQVRAGKWVVHLDAFRFDNPRELRYAADAKAAASEELIAFRSRPDLRIVEIIGPASVDISQTAFPPKWRELPVYRWEPGTPFQIETRQRGMGEQKPAGLAVTREWWLDENGGGITFRDRLSGPRQQIWRLDAAPGQNLGSVRSNGQGQLVTRNPRTGAPGVEIRSRNVNLEATGRATTSRGVSAVGWLSDADTLSVTLNLPPGWRLLALFGADWTQGDWLTSWTLLDLFLLLIFSLAVFRLWGVGPAVLAFLAFGLSFHEPGAPRYTWLALLVPLALRNAPVEGWARRLLQVVKWTTVAVLLLFLVPFLARQVQQALYPQMERMGVTGIQSAAFVPSTQTTPSSIVSQEENASAPAVVESPPPETNQAIDALQQQQVISKRGSGEWSKSPSRVQKAAGYENMQYDSKARIQTGPGVPEWSWRKVSFGWNGPVTAAQQVRPILISLALERVLTILRVALLLALATVLLEGRRFRWILPTFPRRPAAAAAAALLALALVCIPSLQAQQPVFPPIPDHAALSDLRSRLLETSDAYPHAAEIPAVSLQMTGRRITMDAEIHTALRVGVPLPGRLPAWSPVSVLVDGQPEPALRRSDGYLWVVLPEGVHHVRVEGLLANLTEWEWTFLLKPRQVKVAAPGWTVTGVRPDGAPEQQLFFALQQKAAAGQVSYDRQEVQSVAQVDRTIELGLIWQAHTTVTRLSPTGKAIALRIPLLPGENILSANAVMKDGYLDVRLGAEETSFEWDSGLATVDKIKLAARPTDNWVERWRLVASPVWNVDISGLPPTFEPENADLVPVWQPWPGESAELSISRPEAIAGATVTVSSASHEIAVGQRQRVSKLDLSVRSSLGEDFLVDLPPSAEVTLLRQGGRDIPVRKDGARIIIPLHPGEQSLSIGWKSSASLGVHTVGEAVRLPVESANLTTVLTLPEDRWVLWAAGPRRGPAVRFWGILVCALLGGLVLGRLRATPLRSWEWALLVIGLTQVELPLAAVVIAWLFLLSWRGHAESISRYGPLRFNALQLLLILLTLTALGILITAVGEGLLGSPEMFIVGNGSSRSVLRWFQPRSPGLLPQPSCFSISVWWYRFLMLLWALWLAASLIRWLRNGWQSFSRGGVFRKQPLRGPFPGAGQPSSPPAPTPTTPPPLPHPPSVA